MEIPIDAFAMRRDGLVVIVDEKKTATAVMVTESNKNIEQDTIADVIQVGYTSAKEEIKALISHWAEETLFDVVQQGL